MTNKRAERREGLYEELGDDTMILEEMCRKEYSDFVVRTKYGDIQKYRVHGFRRYDMQIELV